MKIAIGSDHGGFDLKQIIISFLRENQLDYQDFGVYEKKSSNFAPVAREVAEKVSKGEYDRGILICGTGIGMSIMANKVKGIKASVVNDTFSAKYTRAHNNSNVLCMGARVIGPGLAERITKIWIDNDFEGRKYKQRLEYINKYENR